MDVQARDVQDLGVLSQDGQDAPAPSGCLGDLALGVPGQDDPG